jgi:aspartate aminotransferase
VKEAAQSPRFNNNQTRYTDVDGTAELKGMRSRHKFKRDNGLDLCTRNQISGERWRQAHLVQRAGRDVDVGDEVIIPAPYWVSYPDIVNFAGGTPVFHRRARRARVTRSRPRSWKRRSRRAPSWVMLNSPSNPSGAAYSAAELKASGAMCCCAIRMCW